MVEIALGFGSSKIEACVPNGGTSQVLAAGKMPAALDEREEIYRSFSNPIAASPLSHFVNSGDTVAICVPDKTRQVKADLVLPRVLETLSAAGVADKNISVVFARGTHNAHTKTEQEKIVGVEAAARLKLIDHEAKDYDNLVELGKTPSGNRIFINRVVAQADKRIIISGITYHYFAGFTGGRKMILPGVAGYDTIQNNHKLVLDEIKKYGRRTFAVTGNLEQNPVHLDMLAASQMLGPTFSINVVLTPSKALARVFSGDLAAAHAAATSFLDQYARIEVKEKADLVIVSGGGHPKDIDFVQSHKAMENASYVLKEGGVMVVLAEASQGFPRPEYAQWVALGNAASIVNDLRREFLISKHTVYAAVSKAERFKIAWVTKMSHSEVKALGMHPFADFSSAINFAQQFLPTNFIGYILPDGGNTLPCVKM